MCYTGGNQVVQQPVQLQLGGSSIPAITIQPQVISLIDTNTLILSFVCKFSKQLILVHEFEFHFSFI